MDGIVARLSKDISKSMLKDGVAEIRRKEPVSKLKRPLGTMQPSVVTSDGNEWEEHQRSSAKHGERRDNAEESSVNPFLRENSVNVSTRENSHCHTECTSCATRENSHVVASSSKSFPYDNEINYGDMRRWTFVLPQASRQGWHDLFRTAGTQLLMQDGTNTKWASSGANQVLCVMQGSFWRRNYALAERENCWLTRYAGIGDICEKVNMSRYFRRLSTFMDTLIDDQTMIEAASIDDPSRAGSGNIRNGCTTNSATGSSNATSRTTTGLPGRPSSSAGYLVSNGTSSPGCGTGHITNVNTNCTNNATANLPASNTSPRIDLKKWDSMRSKLFDSIPHAFVLPEDAAEARKYLNKQKHVIVKPEGGSQGEGIFITSKWRDIEMRLNYQNTQSSRNNSGPGTLIQNYVSNPLLLQKKKFDLRIYVVMVGLGKNLQLYICEEGLARFCTKEYVDPVVASDTKITCTNQLLSHLTNYSLNKKSDTYVYSERDNGHAGEGNLTSPDSGAVVVKTSSKNSSSTSKSPLKNSQMSSRRNLALPPLIVGNTNVSGTIMKNSSKSLSKGRSDAKTEDSEDTRTGRSESRPSCRQPQRSDNVPSYQRGDDIYATKRCLSTVLTQIQEAYPRFDTDKFWTDLDAMVAHWTICMAPCIEATHRINTYDLDVELRQNEESSKKGEDKKSFGVTATTTLAAGCTTSRLSRDIGNPSQVESTVDYDPVSGRSTTASSSPQTPEDSPPATVRTDDSNGKSPDSAGSHGHADCRAHAACDTHANGTYCNSHVNCSYNNFVGGAPFPRETKSKKFRRTANGTPLLDSYQEAIDASRSSQILGFDVLIDDDFKLHLLEVNACPSLALDEVIPVEEGAGTAESAKDGHHHPRCRCIDHPYPHFHVWSPVDIHVKTLFCRDFFQLLRCLSELEEDNHTTGVTPVSTGMPAFVGNLRRVSIENKEMSELSTMLSRIGKLYARFYGIHDRGMVSAFPEDLTASLDEIENSENTSEYETDGATRNRRTDGRFRLGDQSSLAQMPSLSQTQSQNGTTQSQNLTIPPITRHKSTSKIITGSTALAQYEEFLQQKEQIKCARTMRHYTKSPFTGENLRRVLGPLLRDNSFVHAEMDLLAVRFRDAGSSSCICRKTPGHMPLGTLIGILEAIKVKKRLKSFLHILQVLDA